MTIPAALSERTQVNRARIALSADARAMLGVAVLGVALLVVTWGTWGDLNSDSGYDIVAGSRVAHGLAPYADFTYYYGPLAPALSALAMLLGGQGIAAAVGLGLVVTIGIIAATYALARSLAGPVGAFIAAAITFAVALIPNNYSYVLPHTYNATVGTLLVLCLVLLLAGAGDRGGEWRLPVAGAIVGLTLLTKPEPAAAALAAAGLWLVLRALDGARWRRETLLIGTPLVAIPAIVYGAFLTAVSPHRLVLENLYPRDALRAGGNVLVKVRMPLTAHSIVLLTGKVVLYAAGIIVLVGISLVLQRTGRLRQVALAATGTFATLAIAAAVINPEAMRHGLQFIYGWIPGGAFVAVAVLIVRFRRRSGRWTRTGQMELLTCTALAVMSATTYGAFYLHAPNPQMAVYYAPLAAVFLARLHLVELARSRQAFTLGACWLLLLAAAGTALTIKDAHAESANVSGPGGRLAETPVEGSLYRGALAAIASYTHPGDRIFVAPIMTGLYVLSDRQSPLREISIIPGALPDAKSQRAAIRSLQDARVKLILTDDRRWPGYGHTTFGGSFDRILSRWIGTHYTRTRTIFAPAHDILEGHQPPRHLYVWLRRG